MKKPYDLLIVGAGIYGATAAYKAKREGKRCLVIDQRPHLGGNIYCENIEGINVHKYGAHIFHTNNKRNGCPCASSMTTTTSATAFRAFPWAASTN